MVRSTELQFCHFISHHLDFKIYHLKLLVGLTPLTALSVSLALTGRFDEAVIEERRKATEDMLLFSINIPALYNSPQLKDFFRVRHIDRYIRHMVYAYQCNVIAIEANAYILENEKAPWDTQNGSEQCGL